MFQFDKSKIESLQSELRLHDFELIERDSLQALRQEARHKLDLEQDLNFLWAMPRAYVAELLHLLPKSSAQLRQDLLALATCGMKRDGFFVEFGATDGVDLSNSILLEQLFGWKGILVEPARVWQPSLRANRTAVVETRCVWSRSGDALQFRETEFGVFSTIDCFSASDHHAAARSAGMVYEVETISLNDLLELHCAPKNIDFLSVDTEGSEYEILQAFDFSKYSFNLIVCEHNFTPAREKICQLLEGAGYRRVLEQHSAWDDWFVAEHLHNLFTGES